MLLLFVLAASAKPPAYRSDPKPEVINVTVTADVYAAEAKRYCQGVRRADDYRSELIDVGHTVWYLQTEVVGDSVSEVRGLKFRALGVQLRRPDLAPLVEQFASAADSVLAEWSAEYDRLDAERTALLAEVEQWTDPAKSKTSPSMLRATCALRYQRLYEIGQQTVARITSGTARVNEFGKPLEEAMNAPAPVP